MSKLLEESLKTCPIVKRGEYHYFIHPISDGVPLVEPELLRDVSTRVIKMIDTDVDKIVTAEAMGIPIVTAVSIATDIPYVIMRKREYLLEGEIPVHQETGYSKGELYLNGINKGDKVVILDDVISTGGTLVAIINALKRAGADIKDVLCIIDRGNGQNIVEEKTGYKVKTIVKIEVVDGKVNILE
ncbi:adenine phosphoribosyltransferase [Methanococcus maripaludis]|jgi:adenine phosphoribosyltransferase|uniref:Hypoxanthine/guanine phosphoribosyltransferase n=2 Tax=Methanococcus maripaludis TaxID=39152 RepID=A0A2L1CAJ0_METMI|nr:hypoxanthine/guanine phosphoribosyltransferase [Methanococcus maripaludis]AVB76349.1 Xanthine phosphoribosyltransferase [Methanococcus maripaludis]MBA2840547.1 adenine phosphoribosyltransferase [Methanococcus maripaludis]MBA2845936.1 adenine phosphoribosyltransferase [Methanococcus maripaludis]MBA2853337.1 adenine phosphoribosyltransferase [Methanococcus maripaludis]MBA2860246.1 adenine phosphoribosyltransferase [Methanococcus maripaludis]